MKLKQIFETIIETGIANDPRGKKEIDRILKRTEKEYKELKEADKKEFDTDKLENPYADTRLLYGDPKLEIKTIMAGIDIDTAELLLADRLCEKGKEIDLVISHHPCGKAYANFYEVMDMQADIFNKYGVPINLSEGMLAPRIKEVERRVMPANHLKAVDTAKLLDIPFMCSHTVADNCVVNFLQEMMDKEKPVLVKEVMALLKEIPEYKYAGENNSGPKVITGSDNSRTGKIMVDMTGGTEGAKEIYEKASNAGIGTIIGMHFSEEHKKEMEKNHINGVVAGHISSDNLGMNLLLDTVVKKDKKIKLIACSGYYRVSRL